jgi:hypothetical protein
MNYLAEKLIASVLCLFLGVTALTGDEKPQSGQPANTIALAPYLIESSTTSTTSTIFIDPYASAPEQFAQLAIGLGWPASEYDTLVRVIDRESKGIPLAINSKDPQGGSFGLLQINGFWEPWLIERGLISSLESLLDPTINLRAGLAIYNNSGWNPWRTSK